MIKYSVESLNKIFTMSDLKCCVSKIELSHSYNAVLKWHSKYFVCWGSSYPDLLFPPVSHNSNVAKMERTFLRKTGVAGISLDLYSANLCFRIFSACSSLQCLWHYVSVNSLDKITSFLNSISITTFSCYFGNSCPVLSIVTV